MVAVILSVTCRPNGIAIVVSPTNEVYKFTTRATPLLPYREYTRDKTNENGRIFLRKSIPEKRWSQSTWRYSNLRFLIKFFQLYQWFIHMTTHQIEKTISVEFYASRYALQFYQSCTHFAEDVIYLNYNRKLQLLAIWYAYLKYSRSITFCIVNKVNVNVNLKTAILSH